jgi:hypothetical protein
LGLPLVTVATDVRAALDPHTDWGTDAHGSVFAGIGLLLRPLLREVVISPTHWTPLLRPWGSHPELDPWWSTPDLTVTHHPGDEVRWQRVVRVTRHPEAARSLQVCWQGSTARNCGRCEKCLRLLTSLRLAGTEAATAHNFDVAFDPAAVGPELRVRPHPWCDTIDHIDRIGIEADELRQRWETVTILRAPGVRYEDRAVQPRLPLDRGRASADGVDRLARRLAPLGLRIDRLATPAPTDRALEIVDEQPLTVRIRPATGVGGDPIAVRELRLEHLLALLDDDERSPERLVPFDPGGQDAPPPTAGAASSPPAQAAG